MTLIAFICILVLLGLRLSFDSSLPISVSDTKDLILIIMSISTFASNLILTRYSAKTIYENIVSKENRIRRDVLNLIRTRGAITVESIASKMHLETSEIKNIVDDLLICGNIKKTAASNANRTSYEFVKGI